MKEMDQILFEQVHGTIRCARAMGLETLASELDRALLGAILRYRRRQTGCDPETGRRVTEGNA